jgi:hypothetical protein
MSGLFLLDSGGIELDGECAEILASPLKECALPYALGAPVFEDEATSHIFFNALAEGNSP